MGSVWYNQPIQLGGISVYGPYFIAKVSENVGAGVNEFSDWELNSIYPNPSQGIFTIQANNPITKLSVTNLMGQIVYRKAINSLTTTLDLTSQSKGIYFIEIFCGEARKTQNIILQ